MKTTFPCLSSWLLKALDFTTWKYLLTKNSPILKFNIWQSLLKFECQRISVVLWPSSQTTLCSRLYCNQSKSRRWERGWTTTCASDAYSSCSQNILLPNLFIVVVLTLVTWLEELLWYVNVCLWLGMWTGTCTSSNRNVTLVGCMNVMVQMFHVTVMLAIILPSPPTLLLLPPLHTLHSLFSLPPPHTHSILNLIIFLFHLLDRKSVV